VNDSYFIPFKKSITLEIVPDGFVSPYDPVHPIAELAVNELKKEITKLAETDLNFRRNYEADSLQIGKMFGVLVVQNQKGELGYLQGFSGKIGDSSHYPHFVPPIVDLLEENIAIDTIMTEISKLTSEINQLKLQKSIDPKLYSLMQIRKNKSIALQQDIFDEYYFLNSKKELKSLRDIFSDFKRAKNPAGAGECSAPKLFQYAFNHNLTPIALAEFWWGKSPKSGAKQHGEFYPPCIDKCEPILSYMLAGL
jgi:tRNA pseudouridine32 synthase/23S rRNA pseudouridine746 synthase